MRYDYMYRVECSDSRARFHHKRGIVTPRRRGRRPLTLWPQTRAECEDVRTALNDHGRQKRRSTGFISTFKNNRRRAERFARSLVREGKKNVMLYVIEIPLVPSWRDRRPLVEYRTLEGFGRYLKLWDTPFMEDEVVFLNHIPAAYIVAKEPFH